MKIKTQKAVYKAEEYKITYGNVEDVFNILEIKNNEISDEEIKKSVLKNLEKVIDLISEIFKIEKEVIKNEKAENIFKIFKMIIDFAFSKLYEISVDEIPPTAETTESTPTAETTTIFQELFDLSISLCKSFENLNPLNLRAKPANEVFKLIFRLKDYNKRNGAEETGNEAEKDGTIRRPATNWF